MFPLNNPPLKGIFFPFLWIYPNLISQEKSPLISSGTKEAKFKISTQSFFIRFL